MGPPSRSFAFLLAISAACWATHHAATGDKEAPQCAADDLGEECQTDIADDIAQIQLNRQKLHTAAVMDQQGKPHPDDRKDNRKDNRKHNRKDNLEDQIMHRIHRDEVKRFRQACTGNCTGFSNHYYPSQYVHVGNLTEQRKAATAVAPSAGRMAAGLQSCLQGGHGLGVSVPVRFPGDGGWDNDIQLVNRRPDILPSPAALVDASVEAHVQAAVICGSQHSVPVCAKTGQHGFDNDAACNGGIQVYMQGMKEFQVSANVDKVPWRVRFGAGHTLGQLYHKLWFDNSPSLMVPGGVVAGVGTTGLILGCGRGYFSQTNGLACDSIISLKFVDWQGNVQIASATSNPDMLWMAKGGGGEFPGIVTELTMQAYIAPQNIYEIGCSAPKSQLVPVVKRWLQHGQALSDNTKYFTHVTIWNSPQNVGLSIACIDCSQGEKEAMEATLYDDIWWNAGSCYSTNRDWLGQLMAESGAYNNPPAVDPPVPDSLLDPNQGYGKKPGLGSAKAGSRMGYEWTGPDVEAAIGNLGYWTWENTVGGSYALFVGWYLTGGSLINSIPTSSTAYGPRKSKWVIHYKHSWGAYQYNSQMMDHHQQMAASFDSLLPCTGFYNYKDPDLTCAPTNDQWLNAYFSDVDRMKRIKGCWDPNGRFGVRLPAAPCGPTPAPTPSPPTPPTPPPPVNLALVSATASSQENGQHPPANAIDNNLGTRWSSAFTNDESITVTLAQASVLYRIEINWEGACGGVYNLEGSNGGSWFPLKNNVQGSVGLVVTQLDGSPPVTFVRMQGVQRCTQYGYSIYEMDVYGLPAPLEATPSPTPASTPAPTPSPPPPPPTPSPPPPPPSPVSLPLSGATASSTESGQYGPGNVIDGNLGTRWSSAFTDNQWIYVSLGQPSVLDSIEINWEVACGASYHLQGSSTGADGSWFTLAGGNNVQGKAGWVATQLSGSPIATFVRMQGVSRCSVGGTQYGYSMWEMVVYGYAAPSEPTPPPTPSPPTPAPPAPPVNLPLDFAVASSTQAGQYGAGNAIDGNLGTRWSSQFSTAQWIYVSLAQASVLDRVEINWEDACGEVYNLQGSATGADGSWFTLKNNVNGKPGWVVTQLSDSRTVKFVRMEGASRCSPGGVQYGYSIYEMNVYGPPQR